MEIGEYVRTKKGIIGKFQNIDEHCRHFGERLEDTIYIINTECGEYLRLTDSDIIKHSNNIIDLIEIGDFVNGYKIPKFEIETNGVGNKYLSFYDFERHCVIFEFDFKTILTHEQYEENCYKVGDIECLEKQQV